MVSTYATDVAARATVATGTHCNTVSVMVMACGCTVCAWFVQGEAMHGGGPRGHSRGQVCDTTMKADMIAFHVNMFDSVITESCWCVGAGVRFRLA